MSNGEVKKEQEQQQQQVSENVSNWKARLDALYAEKKAAEERLLASEAQNDELREQLLRLQEELAALRASQQSSPPKAGFDQGTQSAADDLDTRIQRAVQSALQPIFEQVEQGQRLVELRTKQAQAWQRAQQEFPELKSPDSQFYQAAQEIWMKDQFLQQDPQGPYKAALMARALVGAGAEPAAKVAASVPPAAAPPAALGPDPKEGLLKRMQELEPRMQRGDLQAYVEYRKLQHELGKLEAEK